MGEQKEELRALERQWLVSGDVEDQSRWLAARVRLGDLSLERLQRAAYLGHPGALGAGLGTWAPPERETSSESSPSERVLAEGAIPHDLLCRAAGEAGARALEGSELDRLHATPRECVRVALGVQEASGEELAELAERSEGLAADERGGLSLLLGIALLDSEGTMIAKESALEHARSARAAGAAAACLRVALGGEGAPEAAAEALSDAASIAEDPSAERAWQAEFLSKLLLDQAPLVRPFDPPSQEARDYEALLEGGHDSCTCGETEEEDAAPEKTPEQERREERIYGVAVCALILGYALYADRFEGRRTPLVAIAVGLGLLHFISLRAVNVICILSSLLLVANVFTNWLFDWPLWGRLLAGLAGLGWAWFSWEALKRDAPSDAWGGEST